MNDNNTNNNTNANNAHGDLSLDELLTHSLLGETTPEQEEVVATALADDPQLRAEFEARKESIAMLQGAQQQTPALSAERRAELLQETQPAAPPTPWRVALSWAAALVLVGVAAILLGIFDDAGRGEDPQGVGGFIEMAAVAPGEEVHGTAASVEVPQPTNPPVTRDAPAKAEYAPSERREVASPPAAEFSAFSTARAPMPDATIVANEEVLLLETTQLSGGAAGASGNKNPYPNAKYRRMFRKPEILSRNTKSTPKRKPLATATLPVPRPGPVTDGYLADYSLAGDAGDLMGSESRGRRRAGRMGYLRHDVDRVLEWIRPRPTETPSAMFFRYWGDNAFVDPAKDPQSTFGVDVDTASYTLTRKYLQSGHVPPKSAIRTEEFVNYFKSGYPAPTETDLAIHVESAPSRFAHSNNVRLLKIGIKAREVTEARGPLALTLLIDVSGSMRNGNRLGLVKDAIRTLLTALRPDDSVAIVTFQSNAQVVLEPTAVARVDEILSALSSLNANGSTNLEGGLHLAYPLAERQFQKEGHNRVLIFSDGVANVGLTDPEGILNGIADKRKQGIYLDSFGVGMGNHNDHLLEQLADRGDGSCSYVDTLAEATRIFRKNLSGVFVTVAKDAKIQVEFDPKVVVAYRQIGYENRAIADKDFRNDAIDAGEVGAGHEVVALYEIEMGPQSKAASPAVVRLRYKSVGAGEGAAEVVELEKVVPTQAIADFDKAPDRFRLSAVVAAFADHLRDSYWARKGHLAEVIEETRSLTSLDTAEDKSVAELLTLMQKAKTLIDQRPQFADFDRLLDELKKNNYLRKRYEEVAQGDVKKLLEELEKQNKDLEEQIKKLNESRPR